MFDESGTASVGGIEDPFHRMNHEDDAFITLHTPQPTHHVAPAEDDLSCVEKFGFLTEDWHNLVAQYYGNVQV